MSYVPIDPIVASWAAIGYADTPALRYHACQMLAGRVRPSTYPVPLVVHVRVATVFLLLELIASARAAEGPEGSWDRVTRCNDGRG